MQPWMDEYQLDEPTDPMAEHAVLMASYVLWALSGRKYTGARRSTEHYLCSRDDLPSNCAWDASDRGWWNPSIGMVSYVPESIGGGYAGGRLGSQFRLRRGPVRKIHSVSVAGEQLASSDYRVAQSRTLRISGPQASRLCDGGVTVDYTHGVAPPAAGEAAAIELANELIKSWAGSDDCALPERTRSVSRQGISFDMIDPMDFLERGRTGLLKVDLFLAAANPGKANMPARVYSPDVPRGNRYR